MAPRRCTIKGCPSVSGRQQHRGVTFHTFPLNPIARQFWLNNCGLPDTKSITKSILVCSRHFRRADFQPLKNNKYLLKQGAVPTIFPWGTLPYVEPTPHAVIESGEPLASADDTPGEINQQLVDEIVKIKSELKATIGVKSPNKRSASVDEPSASEPKKKVIRVSLDSKKLPNDSIATATFDPFSKFSPGTRIEAQDFHEVWHYAKVMEVDTEEKEVLIQFEKNGKSKVPPIVTEWIPMNSSRLRPVQAVKKTVATYVPGDKCLARWTDSRKFPATVQNVFENNTYEVLFDDGFVKVVKAGHMSKVKVPEAPKTPKTAPSGVRKTNPHLPIPKFDLTKLNLLPVPKDGEWCCNWVNEIPIGAEGYLDGPDGHKRPTVLVEDWRLPAGWTKHLYQRSSVSGKWDVVLVGPTKKRFRSKNDVKVYLEEKGEVYNPDIYDFSIHKRRAKDIGLFVFTEEYKEELKNKQLLAASAAASNPIISKALNASDDAFPGFTSKESSALSTALPSTPLISIPNPSINTSIAISATSTPQLVPPSFDPGFVYVGALKVELIDNLFHCPEPMCNKNFRKENHLQIHVKHYHEGLAKLLGVCPNMSDLAYQRTVGQPIDESIPKNQIPNSQFFEKVYQSDLISKAQRKSMSPSTQGKAEHKSPSFGEKANIPSPTTDAVTVEDENRSNEVNTILNKSFVNDNTIEQTIKEDCVGHIGSVPLTQGTDITNVKKSDAAIGRSSAIKLTRRKPTKAFNRQKAKRNIKKALIKSLEEAKSTLVKEISDSNEKRQPLGISSDFSPSKSSRLKFLQPNDGNNKATVGGNEITPDIIQNPKYIHENGVVIKIVRMRQEEIINCLCSYVEEDGLMIQCELCLCWQHGICNGIEKESQVPEKYICFICRNPQRGRESMKYVHDQDWLHAGKLPVANYHTPNPKHAERFNMLKQSHTLTGNLIELKRFMHSLKVKINIAENKDHPKMYLWSKKWEKSSMNTELTGIELLTQTEKQESKFATSESLNRLFSCTETKKDDFKETSSSLGATTTSLNNEKSTSISLKDELNDTKHNEFQDDKMIVDQSILVGLLNSGVNSERTPEPVKVPQPEAAINPAECQLRLLDHIQKQQTFIMGRLQTIEAQIIALESRDEKVNNLEPIDSCTKTKQIINLLLNDLQKMRKIAVINSMENKLEI